MTAPIKALGDMLARSAEPQPHTEYKDSVFVPRRPGDGLRPFSKEWWADMQEASNRLAADELARDSARDAQEEFDDHDDLTVNLKQAQT